MEAAEELRELRALVERAGGRRAVLLVAEVAEGAPVASTLASFARDLLGDEAPPVPAPSPGCPPRSRCRSRGEGGRRALSAGLLLVLCRGGAARGRGNRARLREVVRDVRGRLPPGSPPAAVVGVLLPGGDGEDAAVLDATLRRHFPAPGTVQGARYSPGSPAALRECRAAACRALRAALQHPAGTGGTGHRVGIPPGWVREPRGLSLDLSLLFADDQQDPQEVALTSLGRAPGTIHVPVLPGWCGAAGGGAAVCLLSLSSQSPPLPGDAGIHQGLPRLPTASEVHARATPCPAPCCPGVPAAGAHWALEKPFGNGPWAR
uniref:C2orf72-like C-terminal domain-containing protein n=1 Tax=Anas platyrhynchos platyrhynchos TaxID=8840 RepID=A0A493TQV7_ANAPP